MDSTYSVFQLITCLLVGKDVEEEEWLVLKQKLSGIVLNTILTNADVVINLYDIVSEGRRSLMATMEFN